MRLDKFIGHATDLSRVQIHVLIKQGAITVNSVTAQKGAQQVGESDLITLNGEPVLLAKNRYLMLHKPSGYVCANSDSEHPTVLDLIDEPNKQNLQIAGRLDIDTTGLVLITDDGQWNHRVTSPRSQCKKVYRATTVAPMTAETVALFAAGIQLHGEKKLTEPAHLDVIDEHMALVTISEGKYHQVKRMFAATGNRVVTLHRERIGEIHLDPSLPSGKYRALTQTEIETI